MSDTVSFSSTGKSGSYAAADFPQHPGDECLAHAATQFKEAARTRFAAMGLLDVAEGRDPPEFKMIIDIDLEQTYPAVPDTHRDFYRIKEKRMEAQRLNRVNDEKRYNILMRTWTEIYTCLRACTEKTAPIISRELVELCDLEKIHGEPGGHFDGPRAWAIVCGYLDNPERSEALARTSTRRSRVR